MTTEIRMLFYSTLLGIAQVLIAAQGSTSQRGVMWNLKREGHPPELTGAPKRLDSASKNFLETFPFFAAAALMVTVTQSSSTLTAMGSMIYFSARAFYLPIYAIGIPYIRTLVWLVSLVGLLMVLAPLFSV